MKKTHIYITSKDYHRSKFFLQKIPSASSTHFMLDHQKDYWNRVADEKEFSTPFRLEICKKYIPLSAKILDFGCGYGRTLFKLYRAGYTNTTGIDLSENMIGRGKSIHPYLNLFAYSGQKIPFKDKSFDAIIGLAVFTCIPFDKDQENAANELLRVLKPGGYIYINDFLITPDQHYIPRYEKYKDMYGEYGIFELPGGGVFRHHSPDWITTRFHAFQKILCEKNQFITMNGHKVNGVFYFGKKPN